VVFPRKNQMIEGVSTVVREFSLFLLSVLTSGRLECAHPLTNVYIFIANSFHLVDGNQKGYTALWHMTHLPNTQEKNLALTFNKWMDYIANNKMAKYSHSLWIKHCLTLHDANLVQHILMIVLWLCPSACFLIVQWLSFIIQLLATV